MGVSNKLVRLKGFAYELTSFCYFISFANFGL